MFRLNFNKKQLIHNCFLSSIFHCVMVSTYPEISYEYSWDGNNYNVNNGCGCKATLTFNKEHIIAAFQDLSKVKNNYLDFFNETDFSTLRLAEQETLQYLLEDINGQVKPLISGAFWEHNGVFYSNNNLNTLLENGLYVIKNELLTPQEAITQWIEFYEELSCIQIDFIENLYNQKIINTDKIIRLDINKLVNLKILNMVGLNECIDSFKEIGILLE